MILIDMFQVYKGIPSNLSAYDFVHVLQDPGCFYFFAIACAPSDRTSSPKVTPQSSMIMRRDLCWLTG